MRISDWSSDVCSSDLLRAGLLTLDQLLAVPFVARGWERVRARYPQVEETRLVRELVRSQIGTMVNDVIEETRRRIGAAKVETVEDVRAAGMTLACVSAEQRAGASDPKRERKRIGGGRHEAGRRRQWGPAHS